MKFIVNDNSIEGVETVTIQQTQRVRKAYAKHRGSMDLWHSHGSNHKELLDGWVTRELPYSVMVVDFETLDDLVAHIGVGPVILEYNEDFGLMEFRDYNPRDW